MDPQDNEYEQDQDSFDAGIAAGVLLRKFSDSSLGDLDYDEARDLVDTVISDDSTLSSVVGVSPDDIGYVNHGEVRSRMLDSYLSQRAVDDLVSVLHSSMDFSRRNEEALASSIIRHSGATDDQVMRMEFDSANGDYSALNRAKELYYFE